MHRHDPIDARPQAPVPSRQLFALRRTLETELIRLVPWDWTALWRIDGLKARTDQRYVSYRYPFVDEAGTLRPPCELTDSVWDVHQGNVAQVASAVRKLLAGAEKRVTAELRGPQ